eukprot:Nitzschia sp. Nitz4//scaffold684_size1748//1005//1568//NITZ4_009316-RA/size1748-processed-gene-0.0-mRNA-1//-1//CDS//3329556539//3175//frame0
MMPRLSSLIYGCLVSFLLVFTEAQIQLQSSEELYEGIMDGMFDVVLDVRTQAEWDAGHIPEATFLEDLHVANTTSASTILSCSLCVVAVYCGIGVRAGLAIERLIDEFGFDPNNTYNGLGTDQWVAAGYKLVNTSSQVPPCQETGICMTTASTEMPSNNDSASSLFIPCIAMMVMSFLSFFWGLAHW